MELSPHRVPALVVRVGQGELIEAAGVTHLFKLTGTHSGGRFGLEEFALPPDTVGARPHVHHGHDEYFLVLEGQLTVDREAGEVVLGPGDLAAAPRGSVHGFRTADGNDLTRALCMYTPSGVRAVLPRRARRARGRHRAVR